MRPIIAALFFLLASCGDGWEEENQRLLKTYPLLGSKVPERLLDEVRYLEGDCIDDVTKMKFSFSNNPQWVWHLFRWKSGNPEQVRTWYHQITLEQPENSPSNEWIPPPAFCEVKIDLDVVDQDTIGARCQRWIRSADTASGEPTAVQQQFNAMCAIRVSKRLDCFPDDHFEESNEYSEEWKKEHAFEACGAPEREGYKVQVKRRWQEIIDQHHLKKNDY